MRSIYNKNGLEIINYYRKSFESLSKKASEFIIKLDETFRESELNIKTSSISSNSFDFSFWGLNFIVKSEVMFDVERKEFCTGELNTYIRNKEDDFLLLSYPFDSIGNIGVGEVLEDFSFSYYIKLMTLVIDYSNKYKIRFQL